MTLEKNKLIIQRWRAKPWPKKVDDSILILRFVQVGKDAHLYMTHTDVPAKEAAGLKKGWTSVYWKKWRAFLSTHHD